MSSRSRSRKIKEEKLLFFLYFLSFFGGGGGDGKMGTFWRGGRIGHRHAFGPQKEVNPHLALMTLCVLGWWQLTLSSVSPRSLHTEMEKRPKFARMILISAPAGHSIDSVEFSHPYSVSFSADDDDDSDEEEEEDEEEDRDEPGKKTKEEKLL